MTRVRWILARAYDHLGWQGAIGCTLLFTCAAFFMTMITDLEQRIATIRSAPSFETEKVQTRKPVEPADHLRGRLQQFYAFLDQGKSLEDQLAEVHAAGQASGLLLRRADYRFVEGAPGRISRYDVTLPVSGTYPQVRHFVTSVLNVVPSAALRSVTFQKKRIAEDRVEAEVVFRFYLVKTP